MNLTNRVRAYRHFSDVDLLERALAALVVVGSRKKSILIYHAASNVRASLSNRINNIDDLPLPHELEIVALEALPAVPIKRLGSRLGRGLSALLGDVETGSSK